MKKVYNVSYDLNKTGKNYDGLHAELKKTHDWKHLLGSTWLLYTSETAEQIMVRLKPYIDADDRILVMQVVANYDGWLPKTVWTWIRERLAGVAA